MAKNRKYHGWVLREDGGPGFKDYISVEFVNEEGDRESKAIGRGESGAAKAVEWWDEKVGQPVRLLPLLKGCYRVYTEEEVE